MPTRTTKSSLPGTAETLTAAEVPVTRAMLGSVRTELLERVDQSREETKADIERLDGKIDAVKTELKAEIREVKAELKAEIHEVKAELHEVKAVVARIELLVEEQNARNKVVLDGITALLSRQNQIEERVSHVEATVRHLASAPRAPEST